ncbi:hypothetical protein [Sporosalibacterium faouarense]|uniref:hypothetical protein n=1 Tax=Sporosalibacterium faouarense TaxID=516123 RepID=UPI00192CAF03|nr:hypothetical protein [Sporosalibacterium faouarense]
MIKCSFCGYEFQADESKIGCSGCPLSGTCNKYKCPNCGFEIPKEPKIIKLIKKWRHKNE